MTARPVLAILALACALGLAGCVPDPGRLAIFDREPTAADELPEGTALDVDATTSRYVGEDSAGDRYWVAIAAGAPSTQRCIVLLPAGDAAGALGFCGGPGLSGSSADGPTVTFADDPTTLDPDTAELVGDTLLVDVGD